MSRIDETIQAKKEKREQLEGYGWLAHPYAYNKTHTVAQARQAKDETVSTAGRIKGLRAHGKVVFLDVSDSTASIQVMLREQEIGAQAFKQLSAIDSGDFLAVSGTVITSKTGEITIQASSYEFMGKSLRPLPTSWNAAEDKEIRFRKRYVDMIVNPDTRRILDARWLIVKEIRRFLQDTHEFVEVETPVLQPLYGGTNAKPFTTHMNALDTDYYLRVAPELYLKRLIVGGYERIFEIARNFRNEGIDQTHQPEFTMIEWYQAYADYHTMMDVAEGLFKHLCEKLYGHTTLHIGEHTVDLGKPWPRITMIEALKQHEGIDFDSSTDAQLQKLLTQHHIELKSEFTRGKALFALFDELVTGKLIEPVWIIDYPQDISPLAKAHRSIPGMCERFEAYIGGKELADGWSETTDPIFQRQLFENEQKNMRAGDDEAHPLDEDFLEAMEHGMPPLGGIGIGIDRLVMFLTNTWSIREVIAFPTLRPLTPIKVAKAPAAQNSKVSNSASQNEGIDPAVQQTFPGITFAEVIIQGVSVHKEDPDLEKCKAKVLQEKQDITIDSIQEMPTIQAYRSLFKATGTDFHSKKPSPEALLRRLAQKKGLYTINTAVDAYNLAVIETGIGLGGFDASQLKLPISLRFSGEGEMIHLLGDKKPTATRAGQLVYADSEKLVTIDLNYRDSNQTKLSEKTTSIALYADGAPGIDPQDVVAALKKGAAYIQQFCGGTIGDITLYSESGKQRIPSTSSPTNTALPPREQSEALLRQHIKNEGLLQHCITVGQAMESYAHKLGEDAELWYQAGLLHDIDWEEFPDEHPTKAVNEWLTEYPQELRDAILAHGPDRTGKEPETLIERYLFACDELTGFIHAVARLRPTGFEGMKPSSVQKKLKNANFAAGVHREDITKGVELIGSTFDEHCAFLISVFEKKA